MPKKANKHCLTFFRSLGSPQLLSCRTVDSKSADICANIGQQHGVAVLVLDRSNMPSQTRLGTMLAPKALSLSAATNLAPMAPLSVGVYQ